MSSLIKSPFLSVVIPVYGCKECLESLAQRLMAVLPSVAEKYELVLVDDRSPDNSWPSIVNLQNRYPQIVGVRLSRNFGQHIAITAGLAQAQGEHAVVMDCDLQDPPEWIPQLIEKMNEGYDIVLGRRVARNVSIFRILSAKIYFLLLGRLGKEKVDGSYGSFSALNRKVINSFLLFSEKERHYLFVLRWLGYRVGNVDYVQQTRAAGRSSYSLSKLIKHAVDGQFFQATVLLNWIVSAGLWFAVAGIGLAGVFIFRYVYYGSMPGWTSLAVLILICTGAILTSLGVIGLYIGKIFDQAKGRPLYLVDEVTRGKSQ